MRGEGETIYQKAISNLTSAPDERTNARGRRGGMSERGCGKKTGRIIIMGGERRGRNTSPTEAFPSFLSWQYNGRVRDFLIGSGKLLLGRSSIQALTWLDNVLWSVSSNRQKVLELRFFLVFLWSWETSQRNNLTEKRIGPTSIPKQRYRCSPQLRRDGKTDDAGDAADAYDGGAWVVQHRGASVYHSEMMTTICD